MPLTTTATWPNLIAGKKAKASEVEAKFDWIEGSLWPMASGTSANNTYDIGTSTYNWRTGYFGTSLFTPALNPTTTASGIAIGKDTANASTCLDLSAMPKALLMPMLTTAQRDGLTPTAGMMVYNSTNSRIERYEGGQWLAMNNPYGYKRASVGFSTTAWVDIVNTTTSGRLKSICFSSIDTNALDVGLVSVTVDGTALNTLTAVAITNATGASVYIASINTSSSEVLGLTHTTFPIPISGGNNLDILFKTSLRVQMRADGDGGTSHQGRGVVIYEIA